MQIGKGEHEPKNLEQKAKELRFDFEYFRLAPSLDKYVKEAGLVISHAGEMSHHFPMAPVL